MRANDGAVAYRKRSYRPPLVGSRRLHSFFSINEEGPATTRGDLKREHLRRGLSPGPSPGRQGPHGWEQFLGLLERELQALLHIPAVRIDFRKSLEVRMILIQLRKLLS